jgi:O-antigen polysaccharide polymerase Wzy
MKRKLFSGWLQVLSKGSRGSTVVDAEQIWHRRLLKSFWTGVCIFSIFVLLTARPESVEGFAGGIMILAFALLPAYLWCAGRAHGLPVFPIFALSYTWTYALPLLVGNREVVAYSPASQLVASIIVTSFLGLSTLIWFRFVRRLKAPPHTCRVLGGETNLFFLLSIVTSAIYTMGLVGGWLDDLGSVIGVLRGLIFGVSALATYVLAYKWGRKELSRRMAIIFGIALAIYIAASAATLLIVGAFSIAVLAVIGFVVGRKRVPWFTLTVAFACLIMLHYGKGTMRDKYWAVGGSAAVQPWQYPDWFAEWLGDSMENMSKENEELPEGSPASFYDRVSLIHLLLLAQENTSADTPYLYGATYAVIPKLLVPRVLAPDKLSSQEGTNLINIHFGLQEREDTERTTIGWGLLNEAYVNFGIVGCLALAIILGWFYGYMTRWSMNTPVLSARTLFAALLISFACQTEFSASVYITSLFQSIVPLFLISLVLMKKERLDKQPAMSSTADSSQYFGPLNGKSEQVSVG